jgi:hypothetical protein
LRVTINDLNLDPGPKQQVFNEYVKVSSTETVLAILHRLFAEASTRHATGYHLTAAAHRTKLNMDMKIAVPISFDMKDLHYTLAAVAHTDGLESTPAKNPAGGLMMRAAKKAAARRFPTMEFKGNGGVNGRPAAAFAATVHLLQTKLGITFREAHTHSAERFVRGLATMLYDMDKCGVMGKLAAHGHGLPLPRALSTVSNFAADSKGRIAGSHKKKGELDITVKLIRTWSDTLRAWLMLPCVQETRVHENGINRENASAWP